jgi:uncharacterized membrane protein YgcG
MKKELRRAGFVSLTLGALGCGEPAQPEAVRAQELFHADTTATDSRKGDGWRKFLDAKELHRAWAPAPDSPWRPFYKPTLIAAVATVQSAAMPVRNVGMPSAESEALQFVNGFDLTDAALFVDLLGEQSVAWAAALRQRGLAPVLAINNWPHQFGILRLERPLGALLYYADEVSRTPAAPDALPAFILERSRLGQKGLDPSSSQFDNRYFHAATDFPRGLLLKSKGIRRIVYVNPRGTTAGCEEDDLSEYFNELWNAGFQFTYVRPTTNGYDMASVTPGPRETIFTKSALAQYTSSPTYQPHYYHSYSHYSYWHTSYWSRSSGAWGGSGAVSGGGGYGGYSGGSSGFSSGGSSGFSS